ncbi:hypothetical protein B0T10DRAFT_482379 [Thelonectria olida]|uniref:NAD(P)-binding domain-containing protein n=1 Tax=Thelonectria olida TaxID=1576542 RepID=A0A9P8WD23_9HYPO|nr:hypothetical protein B0T10DRAFT_482379 [Thelonectria olida]
MVAKKVFLTGSTGYIGGDVFDTLHKAHPDWEFSLLVRSEDKGKQIQSKYSNVKLVIGSLDDSKVIEDAASNADIVVHTADSSDHAGAAKAIAKGLKSGHSSSNPGYWIHISGTGILCWYDTDNKRYGEGPLLDQAYDDLEGVDRVVSLPDTAFHRDVDKLVLAAAADDPDAVKVAIVCPPTIYGHGNGPVNRRSRQIPGMIKATLEHGTAFKLGAGKTEWDNVHVNDLARLIDLLATDAASTDSKSEEKEIWGSVGYHFCESGTHRWSEVSELIAKEAHSQGYLNKTETKQIDDKEALEINGFEALTWGLNSKGKAKRARKYLGWEPKKQSLEASIPELVEREAEKLGVEKKR